MEHLTVDEIIEFVSLTEFNSKSLSLSATVNGHIRKCGKCLELVRAFQLIYDEFSRLNTRMSFREYALNATSDTNANTNANVNTNQNKDVFGDFEEIDEPEGFR